jgi:hypothetical protein
MFAQWKNKFSIVTGVLRNKDIGYLVLQDDKLDPTSSPNSRIVVWHKGEWLEAETTNWNCVSVTVSVTPLQQLIVLGPLGQILAIGSGDVHEEKVHDLPHKPSGRSMVRCVQNVGGRVYVTGMMRQVYERIGKDQWRWMGPISDLAPGAVRGLESIVGHKDGSLYAVGWEGEIWKSEGQRWSQVASPTNVILTRIISSGDGTLFACGQAGTLLKGIGLHWEFIDTGATKEDFWDIAWFKGKLYVASMRSLYTLEDSSLRPVSFGKDVPLTFYHLSVCDEKIWSIGSKDVMSYDGKDWSRIE